MNVASKIYRLLGRDGAFHHSVTPGLFGGHARQRIYGRLDCRAAARSLAKSDTYRRHRVFFADETTAIAAGYRPCAVCLPTQYRVWRARAGMTPRNAANKDGPCLRFRFS